MISRKPQTRYKIAHEDGISQGQVEDFDHQELHDDSLCRILGYTFRGFHQTSLFQSSWIWQN